MQLKGKKLLVLAGASVHVKLVEAAKKLGIYTIVTDYLEICDSPAKQIADEAWKINITDVETIVSKCVEENVDGVIAGWIDPCQMPYCQICERLGVPCYGTYDQFYKLTNKHAFKSLCVESGVDIIPEYTEEDVLSEKIEFPVFVKPVDSRGSRGQSICRTKEELIKAIQFAKKESSNGDILIEKYMADFNSYQVTYLFVNGKAYVLRTADGYKGLESEKLDKVALCSISPSIHTNTYMNSAHASVVKMMKNIGFENGPVMLQGFYDNGIFRFYDPGLRFPGVDFDNIYKKVFGINVMEMMVIFALTGQFPEQTISNDYVYLKGKSAAVLFPTISAGTISSIKGIDEIKNDADVTSATLRHKIGDEVKWFYNVSQRLAEINVVCDNKQKLINKINEIYSRIDVCDKDGNDMLYCPLDTQRIK